MGIATKLFLAGIACLVFSFIGHAAIHGRYHTYAWFLKRLSRITGKMSFFLDRWFQKITHKWAIIAAKDEENKR